MDIVWDCSKHYSTLMMTVMTHIDSNLRSSDNLGCLSSAGTRCNNYLMGPRIDKEISGSSSLNSPDFVDKFGFETWEDFVSKPASFHYSSVGYECR